MDGCDIRMSQVSDIATTPSGDIDLLFDNDAIVQRAINNIKSVYGGVFNDPGRGNRIYNKRLKLSGDGLTMVEQDCRDAILLDSDILEVAYIGATRLNEYDCMVRFGIRVPSGVLDGNVLLSI